MGKAAILVSVSDGKFKAEEVEEHLNELAFLAETAGMETKARFVQKLPNPDNRTYVGSGKLIEIKGYIAQHHISFILFDDDLSATQLKNLEKELKPSDEEHTIRIYDRSLLILDIFLNRAQTAQAKTQVELAMNQYLLPRLTRMWTHLERQRGGTGTRGGAGEKEIETDRRNIRYRISLLKEELKKIDKQRHTQRKSRSNIVRVSLVGYTNVGKSTLMNLLSKANVKAENKLFATVDATVRKVVLGSIPFLLSDTVGFIRKLPHHLIESFKSTLDEVVESDLLLHVADVSHPFHESHIQVVKQTLADIGAGEIPVILVLNKIDLLPTPEEPYQFEEMKGRYRQMGFDKIIFISAGTKTHVNELRELLYETVKNKHLMIYPNYIPTVEFSAENSTDEME